MNENDIYKLKYYKYKKKYIELKNRYNQDGGAPTYFVFFFNRYELKTKNGIIFRNKKDNTGVEFAKNTKIYIPTKTELSNLSSLKARIENNKSIGQAYFYSENPKLKGICNLPDNDNDKNKKLSYDHKKRTDNIFDFFAIIDKCLPQNVPKVDFFIVMESSLLGAINKFVWWGLYREISANGQFPGSKTYQSGAPNHKLATEQDLLPAELRNS